MIESRTIFFAILGASLLKWVRYGNSLHRPAWPSDMWQRCPPSGVNFDREVMGLLQSLMVTLRLYPQLVCLPG